MKFKRNFCHLHACIYLGTFRVAGETELIFMALYIVKDATFCHIWHDQYRAGIFNTHSNKCHYVGVVKSQHFKNFFVQVVHSLFWGKCYKWKKRIIICTIILITGLLYLLVILLLLFQFQVQFQGVPWTLHQIHLQLPQNSIIIHVSRNVATYHSLYNYT